MPFVPASAILVELTAAVIPNGQTAFWPNDYYAGPARVWMKPLAAAIDLAIQVQNMDGTLSPVDQISVAAGVNGDTTTITPAGAWQATFTNGSGINQTVYAAITPSLTGAG